jgi:hypothetical protein
MALTPLALRVSSRRIFAENRVVGGYELRDDIHEAFLAIGCSLICLKLLQAVESF